MSDNVLDQILKHSESFTAAQRRVAGLIVERLEEAACMPIPVLAREASVGQASIVPFARKIDVLADDVVEPTTGRLR